MTAQDRTWLAVWLFLVGVAVVAHYQRQQLAALDRIHEEVRILTAAVERLEQFE